MVDLENPFNANLCKINGSAGTTMIASKTCARGITYTMMTQHKIQEVLFLNLLTLRKVRVQLSYLSNVNCLSQLQVKKQLTSR